MSLTAEQAKGLDLDPQSTNREPISLRAFAERTGISVVTITRYCKQGRIVGARKHHLTKHWWIYPPARIVPSPHKW